MITKFRYATVIGEARAAAARGSRTRGAFAGTERSRAVNRVRDRDKWRIPFGHTRSHAAEWCSALNVVCLTGQLLATPGARIPLQPGWSTLGLEVARPGLGGERDAGAFRITVVLPPGPASREIRERDVSSLVAVVGMLTIDTDYSGPSPRSHAAIVAASIERLATPEYLER